MAADAFRKEAQCTCRPFRIRSCRPLLGRKPGISFAPAGLLTSTNSLVAPAQGICLDDGLMTVLSLTTFPYVCQVRAVSTASASISAQRSCTACLLRQVLLAPQQLPGSARAAQSWRQLLRRAPAFPGCHPHHCQRQQSLHCRPPVLAWEMGPGQRPAVCSSCQQTAQETAS